MSERVVGGQWETFCAEEAGEEGSLHVERWKLVWMAAESWLLNKRELEMEMKVSQHPSV